MSEAITHGDPFGNADVVIGRMVYEAHKNDALSDNEKRKEEIEADFVKAYHQVKQEDGSYDFSKAEGMGEKPEYRLYELHSELAGYKRAVDEAHLAKAEDAERLEKEVRKDGSYDLWGAMDADRKRTRPHEAIDESFKSGYQFDAPLNAITTPTAPDPFEVPGMDVTQHADKDIVTIFTVLPKLSVSTLNVPFLRESAVPAGAAARAAGAKAAEFTGSIELARQPVESVAVKLTLTEEQLEDHQLVRDYINANIPLNVMLTVDKAIVDGNGTSPNLRGLLSWAGGQTEKLTKEGNAFLNKNILVDIYKGINAQKVATHLKSVPSHFLCHPNATMAMITAENDNGFYFGSPMVTPRPVIWGLPIVESMNFSAGSAARQNVGVLVDLMRGAFVRLYMRKGLEVMWGWNSDDFEKFNRSIRANIRLGLVVRFPQAITKVATADA